MMSVPPHASGMLSGNTPPCVFPWHTPARSNTRSLIGLVLYFNISAVLTDWAGQYGIEKTNHILRQLDVNRLVFATDYPDNRKAHSVRNL